MDRSRHPNVVRTWKVERLRPAAGERKLLVKPPKAASPKASRRKSG